MARLPLPLLRYLRRPLGAVLCLAWQRFRWRRQPRGEAAASPPPRAKVLALPSPSTGDGTLAVVSVEGRGLTVQRPRRGGRRWGLSPAGAASASPVARTLLEHGGLVTRLTPRDLGCEALTVEGPDGRGPRLHFRASDDLGRLLMDAGRPS